METVRAYIPGNSYTDYDGRRAYFEDDIATVRLTKAVQVKEGNGYDEGGKYVQYLRVPRGVNKNLLRTALSHTMGGSSCHHAYDCCGCASYHISTKMINSRQMQVQTSVYFNY
jgi:hypothetical protein